MSKVEFDFGGGNGVEIGSRIMCRSTLDILKRYFGIKIAGLEYAVACNIALQYQSIKLYMTQRYTQVWSGMKETSIRKHRAQMNPAEVC